MSKIFEALEHSRRNEPEDEYKESPVSQSSVSLAPIEASTMDFENEMITLNQAVAALLPNVQKKIIRFLGARRGRGFGPLLENSRLRQPYAPASPCCLLTRIIVIRSSTAF